MEEFKYFYKSLHIACLSVPCYNVYICVLTFVYFWTWNKIATVPLYFQNQNSQNKTPHSQKMMKRNINLVF